MVGLGAVLVAVPVYLWCRPRSTAETVERVPVVPDAATTADETSLTSPPPAVDAGLPIGVTLGDARVVECHDATRVPVDQCDRLPELAAALSQIVRTAGGCLPASTGGGTITYVADVTFSRRRAPMTLSMPRDGRTIKSSKAVAACAAVVRKNLSGVSLDGIPHEHAHYRISIPATYPESR